MNRVVYPVNFRKGAAARPARAAAGVGVFVRSEPIARFWAGILLFSMVFLMTAFGAAAAEPTSAFTITSMKLDFQTTPIASFDNINNTPEMNDRNRWVVLETYFVPSAAFTRTGWFDDVTMEGTAILRSDAQAAEGDSRNPKEARYIVLTGKTRFFTIPADDKRHLGVLMIPPKLMNRYYVRGVPFTAKMFVAAKIQFYGKGRVLLGENYWEYPRGTPRSEKDFLRLRKMFDEFDKNYTDIIRLNGGLYSKEKTPWALFNFDFYDLIYDDAAPGSAAEGK
jgi:hypothetical protein